MLQNLQKCIIGSIWKKIFDNLFLVADQKEATLWTESLQYKGMTVLTVWDIYERVR
jgi:hypothetical protein